ncbi:MAG: esterase, partial [Massilia sp.]
MYSSLSAAHFDGAPMHKFDWLGQALAIVSGVADAARAGRILANYPHGPMGAPVIWPQQQGMPVYHNRAMWPFVTAYGLKAAALAGNVSVADAAYDSLMRGAALNLSNMENLEWLSGQPLLLDERKPNLIGPVINSKRQLWSVGAYLGMVIENVFGVTATDDGIALRPFVTAKLRREVFGSSSEIVLKNLRLHGKRIEVKLRLPQAAPGTGYYAVERVTLNGAPVAPSLAWAQLAADNAIEVTLGKLLPGQQRIRKVDADPYAETSTTFGPREPVIASLAREGSRVKIDIAGGADSAGAVYNIYRDGKLVAARVPAGTWFDRTGSASACYAAEAQFQDSGNRSHHSAPRCLDAGIQVAATDPRVVSTASLAGPNPRFAEPHLKDWGKPGDAFTVSGVRVAQAGDYAVQVRYHNGANQINLGISGGVKWLAVKDGAGRIVAQGVVQLPHARIEKSDTPPVYSTPLAARLKPGSYSLQLSDFYNMSYLESNSSFSAAGGVEGPSNRFDIYGVRLLRVTNS